MERGGQEKDLRHGLGSGGGGKMERRWGLLENLYHSTIAQVD